MFKKKMKTILSTSIIAGLLLGLTACNSSSDSEANGYYQFVNLVAQSPAIEVMVDNEFFDELDYGDASIIEYVSKGSYNLEFNQKLPNSQIDEFTSGNSVSVSRNTISTYIMYGDTDAPSALTLSTNVSDLFDDDFDEDYDAIVQFANLSSVSSDIDVYWLGEGDDLLNQVADYSLAYGSGSDEVETEYGVYKLVLTESGTDTIIASSDNIKVAYGDAKIFALTGYFVAGSDNRVNGIVEIEKDGARRLANESQSSSVRFSHGISDPEYSDIYLDIYLTETDNVNTLLTSALAFGTMSDSIDIDIDDVENGDTRDYTLMNLNTGEKINSFSVNLQPSSRLLILTSGDTSSAITVNDNQEDLRVIDTHAKLLVSHSIEDLKSEAIEVVIVSNGGNPDSYSAQVELSYMHNDEYEVESGDYDIYIYNASSGELIIETTLRGVEKGDVINLIATDYRYGGTPYQLHPNFNY
jgi:hypothetical protein